MSQVSDLVTQLLKEIGENPARQGLARTPQRFVDMFRNVTRGYQESPEDILRGAVFDEPYDQMVIVKDIDFYSLCEHHLLPFFGRAHVAYIPAGRLIGLSKVPRLVDVFARRLQLQERLTMEVAQSIERAIRPRGVGVVIEAFHLCVAMRGVEKQNAYMTTSEVLGDFREDRATRAEFLELVKGRVVR
jgi:GTP cyclohydrolase I